MRIQNIIALASAPIVIAGCGSIAAVETADLEGFWIASQARFVEIAAPKRNNEDIVGATSSTLSEGFHKGDVVRCVITPNDGIDNGAPVPSNEVTILNTLPQLGSVSVSPDFVAPCETLSCEVADLSEPDEADTLTFAYRWELNGAPIPPVTKTLSAALYAPNDGVSSCRFFRFPSMPW